MRTFDVLNPANGEVVGSVNDAGAPEARAAIEAAADAFPAWSRRTAGERAEILLAARELMLARRDELARLITLESGKPITEARGEVGYAAEFLRFFAEEGKRALGEIIPPHVSGKRLHAIRQPIGVAGLITIWNFPAAGVTRPLGAALAAGCTAVVKPPEQTPLSAVAIFELLELAGLPHNVANLLTTASPEPVGRELIRNPRVRKVSFTGSVEVGRQIMRGAAEGLKRVSLELGGHAPLIVFDDADIEAALEGAVASKFRNSGQTCVTVNRIYLHESVAEAFTSRFVERVKSLTLGDPLDDSVQVGPLIDEAGLGKVEAHVRDAVEKGATLLAGGRRRTEGEFAAGCFFEPTVLGGATAAMTIMREETFGPVVPIATFTREDEVLAAANDSPLGLAAFFYTADLSRAMRFSERLEYGIVGVNDALPGAPHVPFGGVKQSGLGKEGGRLGLDEFLQTKLISIALADER